MRLIDRFRLNGNIVTSKGLIEKCGIYHIEYPRHNVLVIRSGALVDTCRYIGEMRVVIGAIHTCYAL